MIFEYNKWWKKEKKEWLIPYNERNNIKSLDKYVVFDEIDVKNISVFWDDVFYKGYMNWNVG